MMISGKTTARLLILATAAALGRAPPAWSDPVSWCDSRASAVEQALNSGRLILLLAGRETCGNCQYMKYTVCELASVRTVLDADYVCWFCPIDTSTEWYAYSGGLGTFTLPLICVIDPGNPLAYLDRTTGIQYESTFLPRLQSHQLTSVPEFLRLYYENGTLRMEHLGLEGCTYRVLSADHPGASWQTNTTATSGTGSTQTNHIPIHGPSGFFKILGYR
ncbi:MAG: thioredoxin family protein [Verrucomicrobia bacterium]|nr:thioredoxin family protein [Verrucomicrobiota bacterium]MBU1910740.1 thioredoxin family protein [Verrucomicrobiota bacterium]